jgi:FkbM family methyltransferase
MLSELSSIQDVKTLISVCSVKDLEVWKVASKFIVRNIKSKNYIVIVPDNEVELFTKSTNKKFKVKPESLFIGKLKESLKERISIANQDRIGWYLQQFIKFSAIKKAIINNADNDVILIWDADTIPLKKLNFISTNNKIAYYIGKENHKPYFSFIKKFLGLDKIVKFSFITQCFPARVIWIKDFFKCLENRHKKKWQDALINSIDFNQRTGFSEYETLGTFISHNYKDSFIINENSWLRSGNGLIGSVFNIDKFPFSLIIKYYDFISFEASDLSFRKLKKIFNKIISIIFFRSFFIRSKKKEVEIFLKNYFNSSEYKTIIQIGSNDGVQNDPIRKFLIYPGNYKAVLIEPIPYYIKKLKKIYQQRKDIKIIKAAVGSENKTKKLYYISPKIADLMNGDGPFNNWAHGQGSFNLETVVYWIKQNSFRGKKYRNSVPFFISSIKQIKTKIIKTQKIIPSNNGNLLLIVDVQGYELEVLKGIDWSNAPRYLMLEDDQKKSNNLISFLNKKNFIFLYGSTDKIFVNKKYI